MTAIRAGAVLLAAALVAALINWTSAGGVWSLLAGAPYLWLLIAGLPLVALLALLLPDRPRPVRHDVVIHHMHHGEVTVRHDHVHHIPAAQRVTGPRAALPPPAPGRPAIESGRGLVIEQEGP